MAKTPKQWDVWFVNLRDGIKGEQTGVHNVLVLSADHVHRTGVAIVAPITSSGVTGPTALMIEPADAGIAKRSWIEFHHLQSVSLSRARFEVFRKRLVHTKRGAVSLALAETFRLQRP